MEHISVRRHEAVAEIVLDRPEALNALSTAMARELTEACAEVAADTGTVAVLLSGAGERAFCVGADLKERAAMTDADMAAQRPVFRATFGAVRDLPQPTVAAVHGFALGGGCEFALSCDVIVADASAALGLPETGVGLVPGGGGTQLALRRLGPARAAQLIYTADRIDAPEALRIGLVDRLVGGSARDAGLALATRIAHNSPVALRAAKRALRGGADAALATGLEVEDAAWRTAALSGDRAEGIAAFNDKRRPVWPGR